MFCRASGGSRGSKYERDCIRASEDGSAVEISRVIGALTEGSV